VRGNFGHSTNNWIRWGIEPRQHNGDGECENFARIRRTEMLQFGGADGRAVAQAVVKIQNV
jgi:hypothetical protein